MLQGTVIDPDLYPISVPIAAEYKLPGGSGLLDIHIFQNTQIKVYIFLL